MKHSKKLENLPPYVFARLDHLVHEKSQTGQKLWVLSKSDPDRPTHSSIVEVLREDAVDPKNHHYPDFDGLLKLRENVAQWYKQKYRVQLQPDKNILPLLGSKEGIVHFCQAWVDPGDIVLVPNPAFPSYQTATILAGGNPYSMPLRAPSFLPRFEDIPSDIAKKAKIMFLNYPNNPTGATATLEFFQEALEFARSNDIILVNDHAYAMTFSSPHSAPSLLMVPGSEDYCLEFFTFSKAFHMAGWRLGAAVGNPDILYGLKVIETHVNAGIFNPIQSAGAQALQIGLKENFFDKDNQAYHHRLQTLVTFFNQQGWNLAVPQATVYLWVPSPSNMTGDEFAQFLLDKANVVVSPGSAFGTEGKNFIRICVTYADEIVEGAISAMHNAFKVNHILPPRPTPFAAR